MRKQIIAGLGALSLAVLAGQAVAGDWVEEAYAYSEDDVELIRSIPDPQLAPRQQAEFAAFTSVRLGDTVYNYVAATDGGIDELFAEADEDDAELLRGF